MKENIIHNIRQDISKDGLWRPVYHFTAPKGWMNDPNGLIYYKGYYHLFYQYNPKDCNWNSMHWGHAISEDMLHWKDLPIALYPDQPYDNHPEGGCFSGSAVERDGIIYLFYTATVKNDNRVYQTQCMAYSEDGIHFTKYMGNPLIKNPPMGTSDDFRDPKVLAIGDKWYMVVGGSVGGANCKGDGRVYLYCSKDLLQWDYMGDLLESNGQLGTMFECPDLFELDGKWVLICSPMFHPKNITTLYCVGTIDFENCKFTIENKGSLDDGFDYYAPQSFLDENRNRILIAWQNGWLWMPWCEGWGPTDKEGWRGSFSIPRVAALDDKNQICLHPVDNLDILRVVDSCEKNVKISTLKQVLHPADPFSYSIRITGNTEQIEAKYIEIALLGGNNKKTLLCIDFIAGVIMLDRSNSDNYSTGKACCRFDEKTGEFDLQILVDHSSVEAILNNKYCLTANVYPDKEQTECYIRTPYKKGILNRVTVTTLKSVW